MTIKQAEEVAALVDKKKKLLSHKGGIEVAIKRTSEPFSSTGGAAGRLLMENVLGIFEPNLKATQDYLNTLLKICTDDIAGVEKELGNVWSLPKIDAMWGIDFGLRDTIIEETRRFGYACVNEQGPERVVPPKGSNAIKKGDLVPSPLIGAVKDLARVLDNFNNEWAKFSKNP